MKTKYFILAFLFLSLSFMGEGTEQEEKSVDREGKKMEKPPLVRIDLLDWKEEKLKPPARNIFSSSLSSFEPSHPVEKESMTHPPAQEENAPSTPSPSFIRLRYVGCVFSGEKIVGLVIFEGETLAVEKGDSLTSKFQVKEITPQKIVVQGSDSHKKSYPLEGEEK